MRAGCGSCWRGCESNEMAVSRASSPQCASSCVFAASACTLTAVAHDGRLPGHARSRQRLRNSRIRMENPMLRSYCCIAMICIFLDSNAVSQMQNSGGPLAKRSQSRMVENYGNVPLSFEPNVGQTDARVMFLSHGSAYASFLTKNQVVLRLHPASSNQTHIRPSLKSDRTEQKDAIVTMEMVGANLNPRLTGIERLSGVSNYLIGSDPSKWHTNVPHYAKVRYSAVYPGIDLTYYGNHGQLEYDFRVRPYGDPSRILLRFDSGKLGLSPAGDLVIALENGSIRFQQPRIYQVMGGKKHRLTGTYVLASKHEARLQIGDYDRTRELIIDPVLSYSTYLGGSNSDCENAIVADLDLVADAYVTGSSLSTDFPVASGAFQTTNHGGEDVVVTALNSTGTGLVFSTYIGGSADDIGRGIALDDEGDVYLVGNTTSTDFPVTPGAFQTSFGGNGSFGFGDGFVLKLNPQGSALIYSTYVGGSGDDRLTGVNVDQYNNVYATVGTNSTNFPVTLGAFQRICGNTLCGGVIKLNATGAALIYSTYLAGSGPGEDQTFGIALDMQAHAYVTGMTGSPNFPVTPGAFQTRCGTDGNCNGTFDAYVTELNATGTGLIYSTFLGGSNVDIGIGIAEDPFGAVYVYGGTDSSDFPITSGVAQPTFGGASSGCDPTSFTCGDNFITKLNSTGSALVYSTYLGGSGDEDYSQIENIAIDKSLNAWVSGQTGSTDFPTVGAIQSSYGGGARDAFVSELNATGTAFLFSTYLGGSGNDFSTGIAVPVDWDRVNPQPTATFVTGATSSPNFPVIAGAFQPICGTDGTCNGGLQDGFVSKIVPGADLSITNTAPSTVQSESTLTYTVIVNNNGPDAASSVTISDVTPTGTTFSSVSTTSGTCTAPSPGTTGTVKCTISAMATGGTVTVSLVLNVTASPSTTIKDIASVSAATFDPHTTNNSAIAKTVVYGLPTMTGLSSSLNPSTYGQSITFTATVTPNSGTGVPTGTATFESGTTTLAKLSLNNGVATYTTATLTVGTKSITAVYSGDTTYATSTSAVLSQLINKATTTTALTSSLNPSTSGQSVTFTATVSPEYSGTPAGSVTFKLGSTRLATVTMSGGAASYTTSTLPTGSDAINATYGGSANFATTSASITQIVNP